MNISGFEHICVLFSFGALVVVNQHVANSTSDVFLVLVVAAVTCSHVKRMLQMLQLLRRLAKKPKQLLFLAHLARSNCNGVSASVY